MPATARQKLIAEVTADGRNFWSAYDQGRLAFHDGVPFPNNPHCLNVPGYYHINVTDWDRGWKAESALAKAGAAS